MPGRRSISGLFIAIASVLRFDPTRRRRKRLGRRYQRWSTEHRKGGGSPTRDARCGRSASTIGYRLDQPADQTRSPPGPRRWSPPGYTVTAMRLRNGREPSPGVNLTRTLAQGRAEWFQGKMIPRPNGTLIRIGSGPPSSLARREAITPQRNNSLTWSSTVGFRPPPGVIWLRVCARGQVAAAAM